MGIKVLVVFALNVITSILSYRIGNTRFHSISSLSKIRTDGYSNPISRDSVFISKCLPSDFADGSLQQKNDKQQNSPLFQIVIKYLTKRIVNILAGAVFLFGLPGFSFAKSVVSKSPSAQTAVKIKSKTGRKSTSGKAKKANQATTGVQNQKRKTVIEVEVQKPVKELVKTAKLSEAERNKQLTRIGLIMVAGTVVGSVMFGDSGNGGDSKSSKKTAPSPKKLAASKAKTPRSYEEGTTKASASKSVPEASSSVKKSAPSASMQALSKKVLSESLFDENDDQTLVLEEPNSLVQETETEETEPVDRAPPAPLPIESASPPAAPPSPPKPAPPAEKKGGIFSKIFPSKPTRSTSLAAALAVQDTSAEFRSQVAAALVASLPAEVKPSFPANLGEAPSSEALAETWQRAGLSQSQAAEAFADIASAMLVQLVDVGVVSLEAKEKADKERERERKEAEKREKERAKGKTPEESEELAKEEAAEEAVPVDPFVVSVDTVVKVAEFAGTIFPAVVGADATLSSPVQYNGQARKNRLEDLFVAYSKANMGLSALAAGGEEAALKLQQLQQVLAMKEGRRNALDQRVMRELFMSMASGGGAGDMGMGGLMDALKGGGGDMGAAMDALGKMGGLGGGGGVPGLGDIDPELANMTPEQLEEVSKNAFAEVKQSLKAGSITKEEVLELEKIMGGKLETLVDTIKKIGKTGMGNKEMLGTDFDEILQIFSDLVEVKKRK